MKKIRVLYIHQDGLITGSAISLRHFLSAINREKFEPIVLLAKEGPARQLYEELGIKVVVHPFATFWTFPGPRWYQRGNMRQLKAFLPDKKFVEFVKTLQPDIIHINDKAAMGAGLHLKNLGKPIVQHSRSTYFTTDFFLNAWLSARAIKSFSDYIIAISEDETDGFKNFKNLVVINNTVDMEQVQAAINKREQSRIELGIAPHEIAIGMVGVISAKKGAWNFMEMAAALVKKYSQLPLKFLMVGNVSNTGNTILNDGSSVAISPLDYVNKFINQNNLAGKLTLTGFRKDALAVMAALDILVVANTNGVMGRQPIEAQALGVPTVVVQGNNGNSSVLLHNHAGIVLDSPLKPAELLAAVEELINNPAKREEFGKNGREYAAQKFNPATNMGLIEKIYENLLTAN